MSRCYRLSPAAVEDMEIAIDHIRERDPVAALRFVEAAQATFEHVAFVPIAYPKLRSTTQALADLGWRPLTGAFQRYLVFYRLADDDIVDVVRVLHAARELEPILGGG